MTLPIAFLFLLLLCMVYLFMTEKIPVDLSGFVGLTILIFVGFVTPDEAFSGFGSSAVITALSMFIVSASLLHTGIADVVGGRIYLWVGSREVLLIITIMLVAGVLSAFMPNVAAAAVLMPAIASLCRKAGMPPSKLFMPLSYGAILGGTSTLVGTPPNILAGVMLHERQLGSFGLFDFTPMGLILLAVGIVFMITVGRKLLPAGQAGLLAESKLAEVYQLAERLFSFRVPADSRLDGSPLSQVRLEDALGVQIVAIVRGGKKRLAPSPDFVIRSEDELIVEGNLEDFRDLMQIQGVEIRRGTLRKLPRPSKGFGAMEVSVAQNSGFIGKNLRDLALRERLGVVIVAIQRGDTVFRDRLVEVRLEEGDRLVATGSERSLGDLTALPGVKLEKKGFTAVRRLKRNLFLVKVRPESTLVGETLGSSRIGELTGLTVGAIVRGEEMLLGLSAEAVIEADDQLLLAGDPTHIASLVELGDINFDPEPVRVELESDEVVMLEATLTPRCSLVGKTLVETSFRQRFGFRVLSIWREGTPILSGLARTEIRPGDAFLLQGPRKKLSLLTESSDFVVLSQALQPARRTNKAPFALGGLLLMIGLVVTGTQPIHVASFTVASLLVLVGAVTMQEAYRAIEWRAIFLVATLLPVGIAMENTGAATWLSNTVVSSVGGLGPYGVLTTLVVLSSLLSQGLDSAPAVVLLTPVVIQAARGLGYSPYPLMMGVALAAAAGFMSPFSQKANLLVMGAGGYRPKDYARVGVLLTIIVFVLLVLLVPVFFPF